MVLIKSFPKQGRWTEKSTMIWRKELCFLPNPVIFF